MTGMPVRGVSVLPAMSRSFVTGAAPVWSRDIGKNDAMLMREPTITNKKGSEKGRTICKISPFTDPFYYYPPSNRSAQPPLLDTPESRTLSEHSHPLQRRTATWPGGEEREKGRRPSQLRVLPLLANYRLPKGRTFIPKIKNYKKKRPSDQ